MRVLIGVDGSLGSLAAVQLAGRLIAAEKDEVVLYYSPPIWVQGPAGSGDIRGELHSLLTSAVFDKARQHLPQPLQDNVQTIVGSREPQQGLLIAADQLRANMIVLGARGTGPMQEPTVGSLARHVVHHATVPVFVVRGSITSPAEPIRVLLASDGSLLSQRASEVLRDFTWPGDSSGRTITVLESTPEGRIPEWLVEQLTDQQLAELGMGYFKRDEQEEARLHQEVVRWHAALPEIFRGSDPLVVPGHAADQILKAIKAHHVNLVVVGARRQGTVRRLLLGSTSEKILTHAPCSVLVVRGHERP
jgi:nucleotide-binding universal stress UspA family protein